MNNSNRLLPIYRFDNIIQADSLLTLLNQKNILATKRLFEDSAYNGIYRLQYGMGEILIKEEDVEEAKVIIKEFESAHEKTVEDIDYNRWKKDLFKNRKRYNIIFGILSISIFFILGIYILIASQYKILSSIFFVTSLFFCFIFYMTQKT